MKKNENVWFFSEELEERLEEDEIDECNLQEFKTWITIKGFKNEINVKHLNMYIDEMFS